MIRNHHTHIGGNSIAVEMNRVTIARRGRHAEGDRIVVVPLISDPGDRKRRLGLDEGNRQEHRDKTPDETSFVEHRSLLFSTRSGDFKENQAVTKTVTASAIGLSLSRPDRKSTRLNS